MCRSVARLKAKFKRATLRVFLRAFTMCSLVTSPFSRDYIKMEIEYQEWFSVLTCVQYSHSAWFLDGRTSIVVYMVMENFSLTI